MHPLNAWEEEDGTIVMWTPFCKDLVIDLDTDDISTFSMVEYRLDPKTKTSSVAVVDDTINIEFSVVPESKKGSFTRYGYTAIQDSSTPFFSGFCIWDMLEKTYKAIYYQEGEQGGEPLVLEDDQGKAFVGIHIFDEVKGDSFFPMERLASKYAA